MTCIILHVATILVITSLIESLVYNPDCVENFYYNPTERDMLEAAPIVIYGKDVSLHVSCVDPDTCGKRIREFEVYCILKGDAYHIDQRIRIGVVEHQDDPCEFNIFGTFDWDKEWLVAIRREGDHYEWADMGIGARARFTIHREAGMVVGDTCGLIRWHSPLENLATDNKCPVGRESVDYCNLACPPFSVRVENKCYQVHKTPVASWEEAIQKCEGSSGKLASIPDSNTWRAIQRNLPNLRTTNFEVDKVTGVGDFVTSGRRVDYGFIWQLSLANVTFTAWKETAPAADSDFLVVDKDGWTMVKSISQQGVICEIGAIMTYPLQVDTPLRGTINLEYTSEPLKTAACCEKSIYPLETVDIEDDMTVAPRVLRSQPWIKIGDLEGQTGSLYTVILADISGHKIDYGTQTRPYIHWMVANIKKLAPSQSYAEYLAFATAQTLIPYEAPFPEDKDNLYVMFAYRQERRLALGENNTDMFLATFSQANCPIRTRRCYFHLKLYEEEKGLTQVAALTFTSSWDDYIVSTLISKPENRAVDICTKYWPEVVTIGNQVICGFGYVEDAGARPCIGQWFGIVVGLWTVVALPWLNLS